jgi:hypothetical protein
MLLLKMSLDCRYGEDIAETTEASMSSLLQQLSSREKREIISILVTAIPDLHLKLLVLNRLPISPPSNASFRQNLAKSFLDIPPNADSSAFLTCLKATFPFNEVKRDLSNTHARQIRYAIMIYDIAISNPDPKDVEMTQKIIQFLQSMHSRILDGRAAFLERTETKEVILRCYLRLDRCIHGGKNRRESLDKYIYDQA